MQREWRCRTIDYHKYRYSPGEYIRYFLITVGIGALISYLFYESILAMILCIPLYPVMLRVQGERLCQKQHRKLEEQFREAIRSVSVALAAGYSVENAWLEAKKEMEQLFGPDALIVRELRQIVAKLALNIPLEELLEDFAGRSASDEIANFCQVFLFAKRSGGDFIGIIRTTAERIGQRFELQRELEADLAARRLESQIMNVVPLVILLYLKLTSTGYFDVLYGNMTGIVVMSVCLGIYVVSYAISEHMQQTGLGV